MGPWTTDQINQARRVPFIAVLTFIGAYFKRDHEYEPLDPSRRSVRLQVGYKGRDYRFIITGEKLVNELVPVEQPNRGGGGAIDLVRHITGFGFVQAVKLCLDADAK